MIYASPSNTELLPSLLNLGLHMSPLTPLPPHPHLSLALLRLSHLKLLPISLSIIGHHSAKTNTKILVFAISPRLSNETAGPKAFVSIVMNLTPTSMSAKNHYLPFWNLPVTLCPSMNPI